jgi:polyhydroxyalkanoate synthesis regulator phasin
MSDDRSRILSMLAEGKITAEEAERLLDALDSRTRASDGAEAAASGGASAGASAGPAAGEAPKFPPKYLFVKVVSTGGDNVDIRVPLALVRSGLKLTSLIPDDVMGQINDSMSEHGISLDLANLKQEDIEELVKSLRDMEINVDAQNGDNVRIYCG